MARFLHYEPCPRCQHSGKDTRGDNLATYEDGGKHCFSCSYHVFPKHYIQPRKEEKIDATVLPIDFSREVPSHALKWLLQYGLPYSYWKPHIGWSEKDLRLVFPVGEGPEFSIGRYIQRVDHEQGKPPRKWYVWGNSHKTAHIFGNYTEAKQIVLVEDLISANVLSPLVPVCCLFGTTIFPACIPMLRHIGLPIVMWLDKDQEQTMPKKCNWLSMVTGLPVRYVVTDNDPKCYAFNRIKEVLL